MSKDMHCVHLPQDVIQWDGCFEHCNEPLGFIKSGEILTSKR
jgi:hypothetical protein